jgi:YihY family inner membrane protein
MAARIEAIWDRHPAWKAYVEKVRKDNLRFLVSAVAWNILVSVIPIAIVSIAITGLIFGSSQQQHLVVRDISRALQGVMSPHYLENLVTLTFRHSILSGMAAFGAAIWAATQIGFGISTAFQAMFEVGERPFWREKLIQVAMLLVFLVLMFVIVWLTTSRAALEHSLPEPVRFLLTTGTTLLAAFVLFAAIYMVYPNTHEHLKLDNVWRGALLAAVLFQGFTYLWPLYIEHFRRYGGLLFPILVLTLWIYFFSLLLVLGGEMVALSAIREAQRRGEELGPAPEGKVPQHRTMPQGRQTA